MNPLFLHLVSDTESSFSIKSNGSCSPGSQFQLTCTVTDVSSPPAIYWFGPRGLINSTTDNLQLGDVMAEGGTFSCSLLFKSLSTDQAGIYTCYNSATHSSTIEYNLLVGSELCISFLKSVGELVFHMPLPSCHTTTLLYYPQLQAINVRQGKLNVVIMQYVLTQWSHIDVPVRRALREMDLLAMVC